MSQKIKHTELIAQLKEQAKTQSKSEIAQSTAIAVKAVVKERDVKDYIIVKSKAEFEADTRKTKDRAYITTQLSDNEFKMHNATMFVNEQNETVLLTQTIANKLVDDYVSTLTSLTVFQAKALRDKFKSCGGAYGDKLRNRLFAISLLTTKAELTANQNAVIAQAKAKNKLCIYYDIFENQARRVTYSFMKI
jgi:hypothetical protein